LALYFLMNVLFSLKTSANLKEASNLFVIYPILHISYGWGYLKGLIHFLLLNKKPGSSFSELSR
jgi:glucose-6-phosphate-specific signal transduction histidine kinase